MPFIPPEFLAQLDDLGIKDASQSHWVRLPTHPEAFTFDSVSCGCDEPPRSFQLTVTWLAGRRVYIGQSLRPPIAGSNKPWQA
jgi:hypothetical protein